MDTRVHLNQTQLLHARSCYDDVGRYQPTWINACTRTMHQCTMLRHRARAPPFSSLGLRSLHQSSPQRNEAGLPDYYAALEVSSSAQPGEIKRQFYKLSKANHPDLNPDDSAASQRFVKISEAYAVLGSVEKKAQYDRDYLRAHSHASFRSRSHPTGSFSSASTPAGGRPASGLSRRRTHFRGPPPSFYRSGGWGTHSEKREEHARKASHSHEAQGRSQSGPNGPAGTGPGGFSAGFDNDVPHFDQHGHFRTHSDIERSQQARRRTAGRPSADDYEAGGSQLFNFILVSGILAAAMAITAAVRSIGEPATNRSRRTREES